jgi:hypothetical protein
MVAILIVSVVNIELRPKALLVANVAEASDTFLMKFLRFAI